MLLAQLSGGVPRLVNVLAHKCLMLAFGENEHRVNVRHVRMAAADTPGVQKPAPWWRRWKRLLLRHGAPAPATHAHADLADGRGGLK